MLKNILSVIAGVIAASIIFLIFEKINHSLFPGAEKLEPGNIEALKAFMKSQPQTMFVLVILGWAVGSFICGVVIKAISKATTNRNAMVGGVLLQLAGILNFVILPHPIWVIVISVLCYIPLCLLGFKSVFKK